MLNKNGVKTEPKLRWIKVLLLGILICVMSVDCVGNRKYSHSRWEEQDRELSEITDVTWNYCDFKCTYLEKIFPAHDFVVIYFRGIDNGDEFGVCYIKIDETYFIWNQLVENDFYNRTCGLHDQVDYLKETDHYELVSVMAIGKGVEMPEKYSAF